MQHGSSAASSCASPEPSLRSGSRPFPALPRPQAAFLPLFVWAGASVTPDSPGPFSLHTEHVPQWKMMGSSSSGYHGVGSSRGLCSPGSVPLLPWPGSTLCGQGLREAGHLPAGSGCRVSRDLCTGHCRPLGAASQQQPILIGAQ